MTDKEIDPEKSIVAWTTRERTRRYMPRKDKKLKGIDLTTGGPKSEPFQPAIREAERILKRRDTMNEYHSTRGVFSDANYPAYFESLGIHKPDGAKLGRENFIPGNGATQLYAATVQSVLKKDDVLVIPVPTYGFFLGTKNLKGKRVEPLFLRPEDDYRLTPEQLDSELKRINDKLSAEQPPRKATALLHINPHNPTGSVDGKEEVERLAKVIKKHDLRLVIDDMVYMGMEYGYGEPKYMGTEKFKYRIAYPMAAVDGMFDKTITITSLSKAYSLVDLRTGLAVGPKKFIDKLTDNIERNSEFTSSIGQIAMNAVFAPENKEAKEKYLAERANSLAVRQYGLRVFINGWDNDKEAAAVWNNSRDVFLSAGSHLGRVRKGDRFEDSEWAKELIEFKREYKRKIKEYDEKERAINENVELLEEAKPYLLNELRGRVVYENSLKDNSEWAMYRRWFEGEKKQQAMQESLMETGIPGIKTIDSVESGFFMLLDATALKGKYIGTKRINDASDLTQALSKYKGVYLIPGTAMGYSGEKLLLRLSFPESLLGEAVEGLCRIREFTQMLKDKLGPTPLPSNSLTR